MKARINSIALFLITCLILSACGTSKDIVSTLVEANLQASQTALTINRSATSTPSPTTQSMPTIIPSHTPTSTPIPTPTVTSTPAAIAILAENANRLNLLDTLPGFEGVTGILISPEGVAALRVSEGNTLENTSIPLHIPTSFLGQTTWSFASPAFSPDGKEYVSQVKDNNGYALTVWQITKDLRLQPLARDFSGYTLNGFYSGFSKDGTLLFSVSYPQWIITMPANWAQCAPECQTTTTYRPTSSGIFQLPSGSQVSKLGISSVDSFEYKVDFSPDNSFLATVSHRTDADINVLQYIQIWRVIDGTLYRYLDPIRYEGHNGEKANLVFSPSGSDLAFICGARLRVWQWEPNIFRWTVEGIFSALDYSPDGTIIATGKPDGSIQLWAAQDGTPIVTLQGHEHLVNAVAFSPDGTILVSLDEYAILKIWSIPY